MSMPTAGYSLETTSTSTSRSGDAANRSVNFNGSVGSGDFDQLNRLVALAQGPSSNGGAVEGNTFFGGSLARVGGGSGIMPYVLIGGGLLVAYLLLRR